MKANNAIKLSNNVIGVEVKNVQDIGKAQAAGLIITDESGLKYEYQVEVEERDEDGEIDVSYRDPTEQEIFERITNALADGEKVYATMTISNDFMVCDKAATTLQSGFRVGQQVYYMKNNEIVSKHIFRILLSETAPTPEKGYRNEEGIKLSDKDNNIELKGKDGNLYVLATESYYHLSPTNLKFRGYYGEIVKRESEIFATKEELVKHLLGEDK